MSFEVTTRPPLGSNATPTSDCPATTSSVVPSGRTRYKPFDPASGTRRRYPGYLGAHGNGIIIAAAVLYIIALALLLTGSGEEREGVETKHARRSNTSTKPREPDLLLLVESTEEPQQRWPDRNSRLSYGGKSLAQIV